VIEFFQYRGEVSLRQKILCGPGCQPAPGQDKRTGRATIVAGAREEHGIAQRRLILGAARLPRRRRGCRECEALPPGPGPSLLPAHHRIEGADRGSGGDRSVFNGLRRLDCPAQPGWHRRRGSELPNRGRLGMVARGGFGAKNHPRQDESTRRFSQSVTAKTAALVDRLLCPVSLPYRTYADSLPNHPKSTERLTTIQRAICPTSSIWCWKWAPRRRCRVWKPSSR